jgi:ABC-type transport system involved in Fe-S cluster assembly fused permease/ATPase subunit
LSLLLATAAQLLGLIARAVKSSNGLNKMFSENGMELSCDEKQRCLLSARFFLGHSLLIFDKVTSAIASPAEKRHRFHHKGDIRG